MATLTESQRNILSHLAVFGSTPIDAFWLLPCCALIKAGLVQVYGRTTGPAEGEKPGKAWVSLTEKGRVIAEPLEETVSMLELLNG